MTTYETVVAETFKGWSATCAALGVLESGATYEEASYKGQWATISALIARCQQET